MVEQEAVVFEIAALDRNIRMKTGLIVGKPLQKCEVIRSQVSIISGKVQRLYAWSLNLKKIWL